MSETVAQLYIQKGLVAIAETYELFPERLRKELVEKHALLFREVWAKLEDDEKRKIDEYSIVYETQITDCSKVYEKKLEDLKVDYDRVRDERMKEVEGLPADVATSMILDFEKAYARLVSITENLLKRSREFEEMIHKREDESKLFTITIN